MLEKFQLLSVNQLAAKIKLTETWKSVNVEGCPIKLDPFNPNQNESVHKLRPQPTRIFNDTYRLQLAQSSFHVDSARFWNYAPSSVQGAPTLRMAKRPLKSTASHYLSSQNALFGA